MNRKTFVLSQREVANALADYLNKHKSANLTSGAIDFYTVTKDSSVIIEVFETDEEIRLH